MSNSSKNAIKHGCCAVDTLLLPTERLEDLQALENIWHKSYNPSTEAERHLVQELAHADWFLQRATRAYASVEADLYKANPNPAEWTEAQDRKLGRYLRYKTASTNNVIKCRKAVEDYRKARLAERAANEKSAMAQERLKKTQSSTPQPTGNSTLETCAPKQSLAASSPPTNQTPSTVSGIASTPSQLIFYPPTPQGTTTSKLQLFPRLTHLHNLWDRPPGLSAGPCLRHADSNRACPVSDL